MHKKTEIQELPKEKPIDFRELNADDRMLVAYSAETSKNYVDKILRGTRKSKSKKSSLVLELSISLISRKREMAHDLLNESISKIASQAL